MTVTEPAAQPAVRNYTLEMNELIRDAIPEYDHRIPAIAEQLVSKLRTEDPELLAGYLDARAYYFVRAAMSEYASAHRRAVPSREETRRSVFSGAARRFEQDGDAEAFADVVRSPFKVFRVVDGQDLRKPTGTLRGGDVAYLVDHWTSLRNTATAEVAFWKAVSRRIGDRTIDEVYTEEEFDRMYFSITRKHYGD